MNSRTTPIFSVIIPTYQRNDLLAKCLDCLAPNIQTMPAERYEVIVTDDGRETTAQEMISQQHPWVKWVAGSRKGPAANRNNGAQYARGQWLVFTDDDCLPDPQWLQAYAEAISTNPNCLVLEGKTYADRPRRSSAEVSPINETGGYLWSCNFAIQKQLFESLKGFDERFIYAAMEDVDLRYRLQQQNLNFDFVKSASVCHPWRDAGGWRKRLQHQESVLIYLQLHPEQLSVLNYKSYLRAIARRLFRSTIPSCLSLKLKGFRAELLEYAANIRMVILVGYFSSKIKNFTEKT